MNSSNVSFPKVTIGIVAGVVEIGIGILSTRAIVQMAKHWENLSPEKVRIGLPGSDKRPKVLAGNVLTAAGALMVATAILCKGAQSLQVGSLDRISIIRLRYVAILGGVLQAIGLLSTETGPFPTAPGYLLLRILNGR